MKTKKINVDFLFQISICILLIIFFSVSSSITVPFITLESIESSSVLLGTGFLNIMSKINIDLVVLLSYAGVGVSSYVTTSIIFQFIFFISDSLKESASSPVGKKKMDIIMFVVTFIISMISSLTVLENLTSVGFITGISLNQKIIIALLQSIFSVILTVFGNYITDHTFCDGISLLVVCSITIRYFNFINSSKTAMRLFLNDGNKTVFIFIMFLLFFMFCLIVVSANSLEMRVYVRTITGKKNIPKSVADASYIPIKALANGIMPVVFSATIIQTIIMFLGLIEGETSKNIVNFIDSNTRLIDMILIFVFSIVYSILIFDSRKISKNLLMNNSYIRDNMKGNSYSIKDVSKHLSQNNLLMTFLGAVILILILFVPEKIYSIYDLPIRISFKDVYILTSFGATVYKEICSLLISKKKYSII